MKSEDLLSEFVHDALLSGRDPDQIAPVLSQAGWSDREVQTALEGWQMQPGLPPVPRPRPYVSAADAVVYGLLFLSLAMISWHIVSIGSAAIDRLLDDPLDRYGAPASMRWSVAALVAFLPMFLFLNHRVNRASQDDPGRQRSLIRKWMASLTLLIAALVLLGDLVAVLYAFLNGELTLRFLAKAALVALIGGLVFAYYRDEMNG